MKYNIETKTFSEYGTIKLDEYTDYLTIISIMLVKTRSRLWSTTMTREIVTAVHSFRTDIFISSPTDRYAHTAMPISQNPLKV